MLLAGFPGATLKDDDRYAAGTVAGRLQRPRFPALSPHPRKTRSGLLRRRAKFPRPGPGILRFLRRDRAARNCGKWKRNCCKEAELLRAGRLDRGRTRRSKAKIIGQKKISRQDLGGYAMTVALDELYGLGYEHIDLEDARYEAVTRRHQGRRQKIPHARRPRSCGDKTAEGSPRRRSHSCYTSHILDALPQ